MKNIYARTTRMMMNAWPNSIPISCRKSSPSLPSKSPKEKPETFISPIDISDNASERATSIRGCSINAPSEPPNSSTINELSIVTIAKPADAVVLSSS